MVTTPIDLNNSTPKPLALNDHQDLLRLIEEHAAAVVLHEKDRTKHAQLLRLYAEEISCPINDKIAVAYIARANGEDVAVPEPKKYGQKLNKNSVPWCWDGLVMQGLFNLLVAPPKVGKSALLIGMIGAWWRGDSSFLGRTFQQRCPNVHIIGSDQPECDWFKLFEREGLVDEDGAIGGPIKSLWSADAPLTLHDDGIKAIGEIAAADPGSLFIVDSYHACVSRLNIDEATSAFDGPARQLMSAVTAHGCTLIVIHHANKSVAGGNATNASRGSNALPAAASQLILMNWLRAPSDGQLQTDHRVVLKTQGRAKSTTLLVELQDDGWISHGDGDHALALEAAADAEEDLSGRQADMYDYMVQRAELGFAVTVKELADHLNLPSKKVDRSLRSLIKKGLAQRDGALEPGADGGRPANLFSPILMGEAGSEGDLPPSPETGGETDQKGVNPPSIYARRGLPPFPPLPPQIQGGGFTPLRQTSSTPFVIGASVELCQPDGSWANGWMVSSESKPEAIAVERLGNPNLRKHNLRPGLDVRFCSGSPYPQAPALEDADNDEPPLPF